MNPAKKAALYSALLFPGCGQLYLKHYKRGIVFILSVLAGTFSLAWMIISAGAAIIKASPFKKGAVHINDVVVVTIKSFQKIDLPFFLLMTALILLLWILSVIDAYQLGKKPKAPPATIDADPKSTSDQL